MGASQGTGPGWNANGAESSRLSGDEIGSGRTDVVIVGMDGSAAARSAADWAAQEAMRRRAALRLVHAYSLPPAGYGGYRIMSPEVDAKVRLTEQAALDRVAAELGRLHPRLDISTCLTRERPVRALRRESGQASVTVIGSRGTGRVSGMLLGSVAMAIVAGNPAPVEIVHCGCQPNASGPVVVGLDDSPDSERAIAFAFEAASLRQTNLIAIHAWNARTSPYALQPLVVAPSVDLEEEQHRVLSERLAGWNDKYPDVTVAQKVIARRPIPTLLDYAGQAQLVVVGSHGHGSYANLLLGSTGRTVIARCVCPVVIVNATV